MACISSVTEEDLVALLSCSRPELSSDSKQAQPSRQEAVNNSSQRTRRLEILIALRKMYRNVLRAQGLLAQPSPLYDSPLPGEAPHTRVLLELTRAGSFRTEQETAA